MNPGIVSTFPVVLRKWVLPEVRTGSVLPKPVLLKHV